MAEQVAEIFTEVVVAPGYEDGALEILARKSTIRLLRMPAAGRRRGGSNCGRSPVGCSCRKPTTSMPPATTRRPGPWQAGDAADKATMRDLAFAWRAIRAAKSNAILLATGGATVGVRDGPGQPGRRGPAGRFACR